MSFHRFALRPEWKSYQRNDAGSADQCPVFQCGFLGGVSLVTLKKTTTLAEASRAYPGLIDFLISLSHRYDLLKNRTIVALMAPRTTMAKIAQRGGMTFDELMEKLAAAEDKLHATSVPIDDSEQVKDEIVALLKQISRSADISAIKSRFKELLKRADPVTVTAAEAELIKQGYRLEDLMSACELHLEVFRESLTEPSLDLPPGHPLDRLVREQAVILDWLSEAHSLVAEARAARSAAERTAAADKLLALLDRVNQAFESHDVRQENTLFPVLEKYGVEEPPTIMWHEHSQMKETRKSLRDWLSRRPASEWDADFLTGIDAMLVGLTETFAQHARKEQTILYRIALEMLTDRDWQDIKDESDQLGYFELPGEEHAE